MNAVSRLRVPALARGVILVALVAALAAVTAGSASAYGVTGVNFTPQSGSGQNGWFIHSPVSANATYFVDGPDFNPNNDGDYSERLASIDCSGPGVSGGTFTGPTFNDFTVFFSVSGETGPGGVGVGCDGFYERNVFDCNFFGCFGQGYQPFASPLVTGRTIKIDLSPPTASVTFAPPNANGWHNSPSSVGFTGNDSNSGIAFCRSGAPFGPGGPGQSIGPPSASFKSIVGGCQSDSGLNTGTAMNYRYDDVDPTLAPTVSPNPVTLNESATATPNAADQPGLSGIDTASCDPVDTSTVGSHTVSCTATDKAGNTASATASYVVGYNFEGFFQPVDMTGVNGANSGQAIPLKFRVTDGNGEPVTDLASVEVTATSLACDLGVTPDQLEEYASGNSGLQNHGNGNYQFNWKTPKTYAKSCKTLKLDLGDGIHRTAEFRFTK